MYSIERSALVPHSAAKMYALVNDVASYADFLPWCGGSEVLESNDAAMLASVTIDFKGVNKTFTTQNTLSADKSVAMRMVDGPFSQLGGIWRFKPLEALDEGEACKISLELKFDFANALVGAVIGPVFKGIANSMVASFVSEAERRYSNSPT